MVLLWKGVYTAAPKSEDAVIGIKKKTSEAGRKVVIEEFLEGTEVSILAFTDGNNCAHAGLTGSQRALDGDKGLNTGGMGTFSPSRYTRPNWHKTAWKIYLPTINVKQ